MVLPLANTTAELLAEYISARLRAELATLGLPIPRVVRVEVEECVGQLAVAEWRAD